nr:hypothetical protein GTC16762_27940 [Pigmentibacter ruber]
MKKKTGENNTKFLLILICSIFIHFFVFYFLIPPIIKNENMNNRNQNKIVHLQIISKIPTKPVDINFSASAPEKQTIQNFKKISAPKKSISPLELKSTAYPKIQNKLDTNQIPNNKEISEKQITEQILQSNPIESLKLPRSLLGKNIFPKQYKVYFQFQREKNEIINIVINDFQPLSGQSQYIDKLVEKAFMKEINDLKISEITTWLNNYQKHQYASENIENLPIDKFYIVLEFQEPN